MIGAFSEWAKDNGAASILAVEPEPSNAALYRQNHPDVELIEAAITEDEDVTLVVAPNTWRHAVEAVTHYAGGEAHRRGVHGARRTAGDGRRLRQA